MTCSNFARYQVEGKRDGGNFLISGTSGKGKIFSLLRIKLKKLFSFKINEHLNSILLLVESIKELFI
jgi:hypothetical protein